MSGSVNVMMVETWYDVCIDDMNYSVRHNWDANTDSDLYDIYLDGNQVLDPEARKEIIKLIEEKQYEQK